MDRTTMDNTNNTDNTSNTKITNAKHCSLCGGIGHNKRSCPMKEIDDTSNFGSSWDVFNSLL